MAEHHVENLVELKCEKKIRRVNQSVLMCLFRMEKVV